MNTDVNDWLQVPQANGRANGKANSAEPSQAPPLPKPLTTLKDQVSIALQR